MNGTKGAEFIEVTRPINPLIIDWRGTAPHRISIQNAQELVLYKDHFDIFQGNPHTQKVLNVLEPTTVFVYGVATNVCVNYAVLGLKDKGIRGIEVYVVEDAIKELPNLPLPFKEWKRRGIKFTTSTELEKLLRK